LIFKFLILLLSFQTVLAFDKDFNTVNDKVPLEFQYLFDSMKLTINKNSEKIQLVGLCKELDQNLGTLQKEHLFFLMKSEVIKNVLEFKHAKIRNFDMTTFLLKRLEEDYQKKQGLLTPFSQWVWRSIIAEMKYRQSMGLISTKSFTPDTFEGTKKLEAQRFSRYLNYLLPWIDKMDSLEASEFNEITKKVSWIILRRLNDRSLLFKRFASSATTDTKTTIFNIPANLLDLQPEEIKRMQSDVPAMTLKEESQKAKTQAMGQVQNVSPDDLSPLSEEVSKELDKKLP
jgi:hypothetical protein